VLLQKLVLHIVFATKQQGCTRIVSHSSAVICYVLSLWGREGLLLELEGLHRHWGTGDGTYLVVMVQDTMKEETNDRDHMLPCVPETSSGVDVKTSFERLVELKSTKGFTDGSGILDVADWAYSAKDML
jgi:hypothetical protein